MSKNIILDYIKSVNTLLNDPVYIKLSSYNENDLKLLENSKFNILSNNISKDNNVFANNKQIFIFLYNLLFVNVTNLDHIMKQPIGQFLNNKDLNLLENINKSTLLFNSYKNSFNYPLNDNKYLYIKDFMSLLNYHLKKNSNIDILSDIIEHYKLVIVFDNYRNTLEKLLKILNNIKLNGDFIKTLDSIIELKNKYNVLTYIKIRNDNDIYNKSRFNIKINKQDNILLVKYNSDNKHYEKTVSEEHTYDQQFLLGKFTNIFLPKESNEDISNKMTEITSILQNGKDVFTYGYGASGAGKTSSLIYFNKGTDESKKDGILIHTCNILNKNYPEIEMRVEEFYKQTKDDTQPILVRKPVFNNNKPVYLKFKYINNGFKLQEEYVHKITHSYRFADGVNEIPTVKIFPKNTSLGEICEFLIDKDRLVKATTNNPNSSRSHVLVYIKFKNNTIQSPHLIVGDFAGVENKFDCESDIVQNAFLTVKADNSNEFFYNKYPESKPIVQYQIPLILSDKLALISKINEKPMSVTEIFTFLNDNFNDIFMKADSISIARALSYVFNKTPSDFKDRPSNSTPKPHNYKEFEEIVIKIKQNIKQDLSYIINDSADEYKKKWSGLIYLKQGEKINNKLFKQIIDIVYYIIQVNQDKTKYITNICNTRVNEGIMINNSLADMNKFIKRLLQEKNPNTLKITPSFIDFCLPQYCRTDGCFLMEDLHNVNEGLIFDNLKLEMSFYNKDLSNIVLCVFCVLNVSQKANNPPPIPFCNINNILQFMNKYKINNDSDENKMIKNSIDQELDQIVDNIINKYKITTYKINDKILNEKNKISCLKTLKNNDNYKSILVKFISQIDAANQASAIGTLQTVDRISKFNLVNTMCVPNKDSEKDYNIDILNK